MIVWTGVGDVISMSDAQLDTWKARGVGGFVLQTEFLHDMGGQYEFTGDPAASLNGAAFNLQRYIRQSNIVARAKARGISLYLGFYVTNPLNTQTPLEEWFDNAAWNNTALPDIQNLAAAARLLGFAGLAIDQEIYSQQGPHRQVYSATWSYHYPGATRSEAQTRGEVRLRGQQVMQAILGAFPGVAIVVYGAYFPGTWSATVQKVENGIADAYQDSTQINLWDGMTSVDGYGSIVFLDAEFYKGTLVPGVPWATALGEEDNGMFAYFSRELSNWSYAADRVANTPFAWIDNGGTKFEAAHSPNDVAQQLAYFRSWAMDGSFGLYAHRGLNGFDYSPYTSSFDVSDTAPVDTTPPILQISDPPQMSEGNTAPVTISGTAVDDFAVRVIRWQEGAASGTARVNFDQVMSPGPYTVTWTATVPAPAAPEELTVTAEATTGLRTTASVEIGS